VIEPSLRAAARWTVIQRAGGNNCRWRGAEGAEAGQK
jgi:hypothetical protein